VQLVAKFFTRDGLIQFSLICYSLSLPTGSLLYVNYRISDYFLLMGNWNFIFFCFQIIYAHRKAFDADKFAAIKSIFCSFHKNVATVWFFVFPFIRVINKSVICFYLAKFILVSQFVSQLYKPLWAGVYSIRIFACYFCWKSTSLNMFIMSSCGDSKMTYSVWYQFLDRQTIKSWTPWCLCSLSQYLKSFIFTAHPPVIICLPCLFI
jgi:hypothetical protein